MELINAEKKEKNRMIYLQEQKKKLAHYQHYGTNVAPNNDEFSANDNEIGGEEDPMRVRGSFYMAKSGGGMAGFGKAMKQPLSKKQSPNRIGLPKKKAKLRLEPLKPRTTVIPEMVNVNNDGASLDVLKVRCSGYRFIILILFSIR
jgi:hypothetical protein